MKRVLNIPIAMIAVISLFVMIQACGSKSEPTPPPVPKETALSLSTKPAWEDDWERTLRAARKEGHVNFYSAYNANFRQAISEAMAKQYSITLESVTGSTEDIVARVLSEQRNKVSYADVMTFSNSYFSPLQSAEILQPLEKILTLPEVVDPKAWYHGQLTWLDPENKTMLAWRESVTPSIVINTDLVKPGEIKSFNDLLDPKWKGRLLLQDPTTGGGGQKLMTILIYKLMNRDFLYALLKQEPEVQKDNRLLVEWVARGKFPVLIGPRNEEVFHFIQAGAPIKYVTPSEGAYTTPGDGCIGMLKRSPNPNAAKIFINFLFSKEGQTITSKTMGQHSLRVDVPTDHMDPAVVRQPGMKYFFALDQGYLEKEPELRNEVINIFQDYLRSKSR